MKMALERDPNYAQTHWAAANLYIRLNDLKAADFELRRTADLDVSYVTQVLDLVWRFYEDPDKYAFPAQLYFLLTRYNQQRELLQQDLFAQMTVADYLFAKDRIFAHLNLSPDELKLYDGVYDLLNAEMAKPDLVVYVRARVEVLADRLRKRNREASRDKFNPAANHF